MELIKEREPLRYRIPSRETKRVNLVSIAQSSTDVTPFFNDKQNNNHPCHI